MVSTLAALGWGPRWEALLGELDGAIPARVVRHDGAGLLVAGADGVTAVPLVRRLDPPPAVGDWVALVDGLPVAVLARTSLLRRRSAHADEEQPLAANVDVVLLVCGLDRPVREGRLQRSAALAWDAGAVPVVVLTKAAAHPEAVDAAVELAAGAAAGVDVVVTSVREGRGVADLHAIVRDRTVVLLGESGAGKSTIVNSLLGSEVAATGAVRQGDGKGRHTTTSRELHPLPGGGLVIDTPGLRAVGLWIDPDAVDATFADVDEVGGTCRFGDCRHDGEPGCAVAAAVTAGSLPPERVEAWRVLRREAEAAALRATPHELRRRDKRFARVVKDAQVFKGRPR
jgi:ribosome biogenesis GTPase / thiamine phosphate phosphatase